MVTTKLCSFPLPCWSASYQHVMTSVLQETRGQAESTWGREERKREKAQGNNNVLDWIT